jgi:hypothetical protein
MPICRRGCTPWRPGELRAALTAVRSIGRMWKLHFEPSSSQPATIPIAMALMTEVCALFEGREARGRHHIGVTSRKLAEADWLHRAQSWWEIVT